VSNWPLFWCLKSEDQAKLMQFQWDVYGLKLDIPTPPRASKSVWQTVMLESAEEIDKLMRQASSMSRGVKEKY